MNSSVAKGAIDSRYKFIKDYKEQDKFRLSFTSLAEKTFDIQFEHWYSMGFWNDNYICYSYLWNGKVISNVSLNKMRLIITGNKYDAIQIGTVMTDEGHRRKGLAQSLLEQVIEDHKDKCDLFFLSADERAVDLYKKCGFKPYCESRYSINLEGISDGSLANGQGENQIGLESVTMTPELLRELKSRSVPLSNKLSATEDYHLLMFYYLFMLGDSFYLWRDDSGVEYYLSLYIDGEEVSWMDTYSSNPLTYTSMNGILFSLKDMGIRRVHYNFTPDIIVNGMEINKDLDGGWMILDYKGIGFPEGAWFPRISRS